MDNNHSKPKLLGVGRGRSISQRWREANAERQLDIATAPKQHTNIDMYKEGKLEFKIHHEDMILYKYAESQCIGDCLDYLAERIKTIDFNTLRIALACKQPDEAADLAKELAKRSIASLLVNRLSDEINTCISSWRNGLINAVIIISDNVLPQVAECHKLNCVTLLISANVPLPHVFQKRIAAFAVDKGTFLENLVLVYPPPPAIEIIATAAPEAPNSPEAPELPKTPEVPNAPDAPGSPEVANSPEAQDLPDSQEAPGSPEVPDSQEVTKTPEVPNSQEVPETPEVPSSPETPEADATQTSDDLVPFPFLPFLPRPGYLCHDESKTENIHAFNKKDIFVWTRKLGTECNNIDEVNNVKDYIKNAMNRQAIGVQRFAWPLAADNRSMCIIGNRGTGKSWSYLPTLCQRYAEPALQRNKKSNNGPSCIIICASAAEGDKIAKSCKTLLEAWNKTHHQLFIQKLFTRCDLDRLHTMNFTGILIANCDLLWQFKSNLKLGGIKCIAFDDFPASLRYAIDCENLLNYFLRKLKFDEDHAQLFIIGRAWSDIILECVLKKIPDALLMFEDPLEATAFFNVQMDLRLISPNNKISSIMEMLEMLAADEDLVDEWIYIACCEKNDALVLGQSLNEAQIEYTILEPDLIHEFVMNPTKVVIVYDEAIPKLLNAKLGIGCLIHYTIPAAWMVFKARFALLYNDYPQKPKSSNVKSIIPMSRINSSQMWLMCNFLFTQGRLPPENCLSLLMLLRQQNESQYPRDLEPLCHQVVAFGNCYRQQCCFRHVFWTNEVDINDDLPTTGAIRFRVLTNKTPSLCCVRLEKFPHHINFFNHSVTILGEQIQKDYELKQIKKRHVNPKIGDICIILMNRLYQRVKVLKVKSNNEIQVIQLDAGSEFFLVEASDLLECDTKYLDKEFEACDVRVIGLSPLNADRRWSEAAKKLVRHKFFNRKITTDRVYTAYIMYQFHSILYVRNIYDEEGNDLQSFVLKNCPSYVDDNVLMRLEKLRETAKDPRGDVEEDDT